ncbi:MAG: hypothetical protein EOP83_15005 [Verrucomicrobiaceae bacterium]|nr:MAG: hypothetical protein EOP83_15005 [Verrucomicrobiaceae bacterium]
MRKLPAIIHRLLILAACLLLSACFDIHEEVWIAQDGSGRAELRYTVPESALRLNGGTFGTEKKIRDLITAQPSLSLDGVFIDVKDNNATVTVRVSTKSMLSLRKLKKSEGFKSLPESTANIVGHFDVGLRGLDVDFARTVQVKEALGIASFAIRSNERRNRKLTYIVHLPKAAKENNATLVTDDGKTLTWDYTLGEAMKKPIITSFRAAIPIPRYLWAAAAGVLIVIVGIVVWAAKKIRRLSRRDTSPL